ncbi:MAG: tRNA pseudouridine(55) synthase TruB [Candidatus Pacebacteria bacterium]|nr:tRNA pseudouridine(55) synthase TruB [Candidatus Paceibacterota bacterium]
MTNPKIIAESGILLVDKPEDWTSHDVVNCVRRRFRVKKVGHCGTLDPKATGLLVLVLGRATKLSAQLSGQDKWYTGTMRLGETTTTQDREGDVVATASCDTLTDAQVDAVFAKFTGELEQLPPMVSAVKKNGKPLYKLARKGIEVEREPRTIYIHEFQPTSICIPDVNFDLHCSKGTYVRTLCEDVGRELGCGAHLYALRRIQSGQFHVDDSVTTDTIKTWEREQLLSHLIPLQKVLASLTDGEDQSF